VPSSPPGQSRSTQGDAFFVAFARATDAAAAAVAGQRALLSRSWPDGADLRVRMGLHTGEPTVAGERYVGLDVHRAARVAAVAHGAQVLCTQPTRDLLEDLPTVDLGEHRLKDLAAPQRLYQLCAEGLPQEFAPPRTLGSRPTNLPCSRPLSSAAAASSAISARWCERRACASSRSRVPAARARPG
jgi:class 3 adenylate cyclase